MARNDGHKLNIANGDHEVGVHANRCWRILWWKTTTITVLLVMTKGGYVSMMVRTDGHRFADVHRHQHYRSWEKKNPVILCGELSWTNSDWAEMIIVLVFNVFVVVVIIRATLSSHPAVGNMTPRVSTCRLARWKGRKGGGKGVGGATASSAGPRATRGLPRAIIAICASQGLEECWQLFSCTHTQRTQPVFN